MGMLITATILWTLLLVRKTFILVDESWLRTYVAYAHGSVEDCYNERFADGSPAELLGVPIKTYKDCEEEE